MVAAVGESDHAVVVLALVEGEGAEVYPCASAHLLVDFELCDAPFVVDGVCSVGHGVGERLVADVDGISAFFGDVGYPLCYALFFG